MARKPFDLSKARVLISNDDGIDASGIKVLEKVVRKVAGEVWVMAPETEQSAVSHSITMRRPLKIKKLSERRYCVDGTPADSVMMAVRDVMEGNRPDLLLTGINRGGNLGEDVLYSGTVGAAKEGAMAGIRSIALSQEYKDGNDVHWETSEHWLERVLLQVLSLDEDPGIILNINFPSVKSAFVTGIEATLQGQRKMGREIMKETDPRGGHFRWVGANQTEMSEPGTDIDAISRGAISVTPLSLDITHTGSLDKLRAKLSD